MLLTAKWLNYPTFTLDLLSRFKYTLWKFGVSKVGPPWADVDENRSPLLAHSDHFIPTQKTNAASILIGFVLSHQRHPREAGRGRAERPSRPERPLWGPCALVRPTSRISICHFLRSRPRFWGSLRPFLLSWKRCRRLGLSRGLHRCQSLLERPWIVLRPFEAIAAYTLGIASFWGCLRRTRSLAGGWKFQWTAAKSSDGWRPKVPMNGGRKFLWTEAKSFDEPAKSSNVSIRLWWWKWSGTDYYSTWRSVSDEQMLMSDK